MLAIETRYIGPTNHRGSRIAVRVSEDTPTRKLFVGWDDALGTRENHEAAAKQLAIKLGWTADKGYGAWVIGATANGYVFVCDTIHSQDRLEW